jgi:hypothetical protein
MAAPDRVPTPQPGQVHQTGPVHTGYRLEPGRDQRVGVTDAQQLIGQSRRVRRRRSSRSVVGLPLAA